MKQLGDNDITSYKPLIPTEEYLGSLLSNGLFKAPGRVQETLVGKKRFFPGEETWQIKFLHSIGVTLSSSLDMHEVLSSLFFTLKKFIEVDVISLGFSEKVWSGRYVVSSFALENRLIKEFADYSACRYLRQTGEKTGSDSPGVEYIYSPPAKAVKLGDSTPVVEGGPYFANSTFVSLKIEGVNVGVLTLFRKEGVFSNKESEALHLVAEQTGQTLVNSLEYMQVVKLASRDGLTGILNRRVFDEIMSREYQRAVRYSSPLSLILIDIDHFKKINDRFGHQTGDCVLKEVSSVMGRSIREVDILARYGGEEFVLLLPGTGKELAFNTAERIRECVNGSRTEYNSESIGVTVSMGVSSLDPSRQEISLPLPSIAELIRQADSALYEAKNSGRDMVVSFEEPLSVVGEKLFAL